MEGPIGLLNEGNICYFNSLVQSYFYIPAFTLKILEWDKPGPYDRYQDLLIEQL